MPVNSQYILLSNSEMQRPWNKLLLVSISATAVLSDFHGPTFPAPTDLESNTSLVSTAWDNVTSTFEIYLSGSSTELIGPSGLKKLTFSLGMFSVHDQSAAGCLQFHHTSAEVANSTTGLTKVDGNSIYRVASITKVITIFAGMLELHTKNWDRPITDFILSLANSPRNSSEETNPEKSVQWDKVTLAALGAHMAGTARDVIPYDPGDYLYTEAKLVGTYGLPPLDPADPSAFPPCVKTSDGNCTNNDYAMGAQARPPVFLPWTSPSYTDFGFMLLGIAIANITGKTMDNVYRESIFGPLNMTSSSSMLPDQSEWKNHVIPGDVANGLLTPELAPEVSRPSGGVFSTINDLARLGTAMLNSTLLPPDQTRRWMKQVSHTASLENSIGRPWEIYRYTHQTSGIVTDIYTKGGDSGAYGGYIALIPDFDVGFSILGTSSLIERSPVTALLADIVTETMLPALMAQAEAEAERNFAGTYTSATASLNSTLTLAVNRTEGAKPGLVITTFISNGTDVLLAKALGSSPVRLLPSVSDSGTGEIAFRASAHREPEGGLFYRQLNVDADWLLGDSGTYGGMALGLFVFDVDNDGRANAVTPAGWRVKLERSS